ncbi:DMT family transporter [Aestuariivirga litoralis]|uniref:DMT family transporter n=1 Tax=Aestuariivirga litoralis TaxID=2650924 RepID=UPI0018C4E605|nr:EamA family transporter [Aestuariivirga litoralis]MBG1233108.1 EamA family transporter [Aestuariivirga litoralis]
MTPRNIMLALLAPLCWGVTFTLAKPMVEHFPPLFMMLMVYSGIAVVMAFTHRGKFLTPWPKLLLIAALSVTVQGALLFYGMRGVPASTANLVLQTQVPAGVIMGWLIAGEKLDVTRAIGTLIAVAGVVIVIGLPAERPPLVPVVLIIISGFVWAAGQVCARMLSQDSGVKTLKANAWFGTPQLLLATLLLERGQIDSLVTATPYQWFLLVFCGVFGFYVAYMVWFTLLKSVRVDQAVPFILLMTPIGLVSAVLFLGETITNIQLLGGAVLMVGLAIVSGVGKSLLPARWNTA